MVVLTHARYNVSGSTYATVTAYDGTSDSSGTLLWQCDLGQADAVAGTNWQAGQPRIDADGNVYVASWGITGNNAGGLNNHDYNGRLTKIDINGSVVWDYYTETYRTNNSTVAGTVGDNALRAPCCSIMDDGNIVFGHFAEPTSTRIMSIIDPSGSLVGGVVYPGGSIPTISVITPVCSIDCDASGNIYFTTLVPPTFEQKVFKVDSSGTYIGTFTGVAQLSAIRVDRVNGKFYVGTYQTTSSWASGNVALYQVDCSSMTSDWAMSLTDIAAGSATSQSTSTVNSLAISPSGDEVYSTITGRTSGGVFQAQSFSADGNTGTKGMNWSTNQYTSLIVNFCGAACDPITGDRFVTQTNGVLADRLWKLDSSGVTLWHALSASVTFRAIEARAV